MTGFLKALLEWLRYHPRRRKCDMCGRKVWVSGLISFVVCSECEDHLPPF